MEAQIDYKEVTLDTLNQGAVRDLFEAGWQRLLANLGDINTEATQVRTLQITIKVKPDKNRDSAKTLVAVTERFAQLKPHEHFILLSSDGRSVHASVTDPKQQDLALAGENEVPFPAAAEGSK